MHMNHMLLAAGLLGSVPAYAQAPAVGGVPVPLPATITAPLPAGTNPLGSVGVTALPPLPAGNNALGSVGVTALPPLPPGTNALGSVGVSALPPLPAGANSIGSVTASPVGSGPGLGGYFGTSPSLGTLHLTCLVNSPGAYRVVTYGSTPVVLAYDDGAGNSTSYELLDPGAGQGRQGASTSPEMGWFKGRVRVYGDPNASASGRSDGGCS
jgi:hypothetical protein